MVTKDTIYARYSELVEEKNIIDPFFNNTIEDKILRIWFQLKILGDEVASYRYYFQGNPGVLENFNSYFREYGERSGFGIFQRALDFKIEMNINKLLEYIYKFKLNFKSKQDSLFFNDNFWFEKNKEVFNKEVLRLYGIDRHRRNLYLGHFDEKNRGYKTKKWNFRKEYYLLKLLYYDLLINLFNVNFDDWYRSDSNELSLNLLFFKDHNEFQELIKVFNNSLDFNNWDI